MLFPRVPDPPTTAEWSESNFDPPVTIECPVCFSVISQDSVRRHTEWHEKLKQAVTWASFP